MNTTAWVNCFFLLFNYKLETCNIKIYFLLKLEWLRLSRAVVYQLHGAIEIPIGMLPPCVWFVYVIDIDVAFMQLSRLQNVTFFIQVKEGETNYSQVYHLSKRWIPTIKN